MSSFIDFFCVLEICRQLWSARNALNICRWFDVWTVISQLLIFFLSPNPNWQIEHLNCARHRFVSLSMCDELRVNGFLFCLRFETETKSYSWNNSDNFFRSQTEKKKPFKVILVSYSPALFCNKEFFDVCLNCSESDVTPRTGRKKIEQRMSKCPNHYNRKN